jgi:ferritin
MPRKVSKPAKRVVKGPAAVAAKPAAKRAAKPALAKALPAPDPMFAAINRQIGEEVFSAYLYLAMAGYFESLSLDGMAQWMKAQSVEEIFHALKFFDFISERGGQVELPAIPKPQVTWESPLAAFRAAYEHERFITGRIHALVDLATAGKDHAALAMLQWFVTEQVEEEVTTQKVADTLARIGNSGQGIIMIDRELAARPMPVTRTVPAGPAGA